MEEKPPTPSTSAVTTEGAPSAGLQSLRAYRARKSRPCDRCRSRKMRCVLLVENAACLSCDLSGAACIYTDGSPTNSPKPDRSQTTGKGKQTSRSSTPGSAATPTGKAPARSQSLPQPPPAQPQPHPQPTSRPNTASTATPPMSAPPVTLNYTLPPPSAPSSRTSLADLVVGVSTTLSAAKYLHSQRAPVAGEALRALDLEAGEEEEVYLVSTASERDALMLNLLAPAHRNAPLPTNAVPGLKVRHVSPAIAFCYYATKPYDSPAPGRAALDQLSELLGPANIDLVMQRYIQVDGEALPIWSAEHFAAVPSLDVGLSCAYIAAGLTYTPELRHLQKKAWETCYAHFRSHTPRARLAQIQSWLVDLYGRSQVNPSGNYIRLGSLISVARLLGLHLDCSSWDLPQWERDLRTRLWWALLQYDRWSALAFGRSSSIGYEDQNTPPLPQPPAGAPLNPSFTAFVALCELTVIMDSLHRRLNLSGQEKLSMLEEVGLRLDRWRKQADLRGLWGFGPDQAPPGVRSLQLTYYYSGMILARETWDCVAGQNPAADVIGQRTCLACTLEMVDFVTSLRPSDLASYWSCHATYFLSTCLTTLVRLTVSSDRSDQSTEAIWQLALFALRRFISALADAREASWDVASLTYSRATFFIPLLAARAPEFGVVLEPLSRVMPTAAPLDDDLERFLASFTATDSGLFDPSALGTEPGRVW